MEKKHNGLGVFGKVAGLGSLASVGAFAADPQWYTDLTTQLGSVNTMVVATLGLVITIFLAPLAWTFVKRVLSRG